MKGINFDFEITLGEKDYTVEVTGFKSPREAPHCSCHDDPRFSDSGDDAEFDYDVYLDGKDVLFSLFQDTMLLIESRIIQKGNDNCIGIQEDGLEQKYEQDMEEMRDRNCGL